jgi:hypothetical protein
LTVDTVSVSQFTIERYGKYWAIWEYGDQRQRELVAVTVYKVGAREIVRRLQHAKEGCNEHSGRSHGGHEARIGAADPQ